MIARFALLIGLVSTAQAGDRIHEITYPPLEAPGKLTLGVTYRLWVPESVEPLRGVIVHQHGCGTGACQGGYTAAEDLHWQALARKWNCALMGPSYHQVDGQNCRLWCDPRNGSAERFLQSLAEFAVVADRPELTSVPWCLWGHSGGAFWSSIMQALYPERIVAIWFRSGSAISYWQKGEIEAPEFPPSAFTIPAMLNPGLKEKDDQRFRVAYDGALAMLDFHRPKGAPMGFAPDPRTAHECGDSRYLAIPFFDWCLERRLPASGATALRPIDMSSAWLADRETLKAVKASEYTGDATKAAWIPDAGFAPLWEEYVTTGAVSDSSVPPAPKTVAISVRPDGSALLTWSADADFESGIRHFNVYRDGKPFSPIPAEPKNPFGRPLFQGMSYHDTPVPAPALMELSIRASAVKGNFAVTTINSAGLESKPTEAIALP